MKCPVDSTVLLITDRSGVEIDYCPECRGVWLDRGELDKLIDRSTGPLPAAVVDRDNQGLSDDLSRERGRAQHGRDGRRRREGFLSDLFDF
ncbi:MAG: zf-TFIIB domain-containing protein [Microbacterium sp.]